MTETQTLLAEYSKNGSEAAFRELVARYADFVHSAAVRLTHGDAQLAKDVSQIVFANLARKAQKLPPDVLLGGWLHRDVCFVGRTIMRGEHRRQSRERQAVAMNAMPDHSEANLAQVAPILDEAINELGTQDRAAILLRFFEQRDLRSVGAAMKTSENAARMRVTRALEKLHSHLRRRGVILSAAALGSLLTVEGVTAAPAGLAASFSSAALASAGAAGGASLTLLKLTTMTNLKLGVISAIVVAGTVTQLVLQNQTLTGLRGENAALRRQIAQLTTDNQRDSARRTPRLPAPAVVLPPEPPMAETSPTNQAAKSSTLTLEQVESYLSQNRRNAESLLAAFFATEGDKSFLTEALAKYPNDPRVALAAVRDSSLSPEQHREWLEKFKQNAPDNALANYFSAAEYFKTGQADEAVKELVAAGTKPNYKDYGIEAYQNAEEAYRAAGYSEVEANRAISMAVPEYLAVKQLDNGLVELMNSYRRTGDEASAQAVLQIGAALGQRMDNPAGQLSLGQYGVGLGVERQFLGLMDPNASFGTAGQTVQGRIDEITAQIAALKVFHSNEGANGASGANMMSDQDKVNFVQRMRMFGGFQALQWNLNKYGNQ